MTPDAYIDAVPEPKRSELRQLHDLIRRTVPRFPVVVVGNMIGYGPYHYRYESGREGEATRIALAANKTGISVYVAVVDDKGYLAEQAGRRLGKANVGKSCIRVKRLADLDLAVLEEVLRRASKLRGIGEI